MIKRNEAIVLTDIAETEYRKGMEYKIAEFCNGFISAQIAIAAKERMRYTRIVVPEDLDYCKVRTHVQMHGGFSVTCCKEDVRIRVLEIHW